MGKLLRLVLRVIWFTLKNTIKMATFALAVFFISKLSIEYFDRLTLLIVNESVENIYNKNRVGTSFQFKHKDKTYTVTAGHLCNGAKEVIVHNRSVKVLALSYQTDLCILEPVTENIALYASEDELEVHEKIFTIGSPQYLTYSMREGRVIADNVGQIVQYDVLSDEDVFKCVLDRGTPSPYGCLFDVHAVHTTIYSAPGASGSPVLNKWGLVIGVVHAIQTVTNTTYFIPVEDLIDLVERYETKKSLGY